MIEMLIDDNKNKLIIETSGLSVIIEGEKSEMFIIRYNAEKKLIVTSSITIKGLAVTEECFDEFTWFKELKKEDKDKVINTLVAFSLQITKKTQ
jgi:hypothetical protein